MSETASQSEVLLDFIKNLRVRNINQVTTKGDVKLEQAIEDISQNEAIDLETQYESACEEVLLKYPQSYGKFKSSFEHVAQQYPELEGDIKKALSTPQLGEHHNEGDRMSTHVAIILETLSDIQENRFPPEIDDEIKEILRNTVVLQNNEVNTDLKDYAFLHDIAKPESLMIKLEGETNGREISFDAWQEIEKKGKPYRMTLDTGKELSIKSISYYHPSEKELGQHGNKGTDMLLKKNISVPDAILISTKNHEVAYQFGKINAKTYEKYFLKPGYSEQQQNFILTASYIDTMASLNKNNKPELKDFINLVNSRKNSTLIQAVVSKTLQEQAGKAEITDKDLNSLKEADKLLTEEDIRKKITFKKSFTREQLEPSLNEYIYQGIFTEGEKEEIINILLTPDGLKQLGKKFGPKMKYIKEILAKIE